MVLTLYPAAVLSNLPLYTHAFNLPLLLRLFLLFGLLLHNINHKCTTQQNRRLINAVVLITQRPNTASLQNQTRIIHKPLPNPPRRERPQDMPMRHNQHIARLLAVPKPALVVLVPNLRNNSIEPRLDIARRLPALAPVAPDIPV
jgi:hypothetical protein